MIEPPLAAARIAETVTASVLNTPVKLMSMTSWHCRAEICQVDRPTSMMPALAHTMSRPSSETPDVAAALQLLAATHVSAGRDGVAAGLFDQHLRFVKILLGGHRVRRGVGSPSAMQMAWGRPWLRPTPVMNATLPIEHAPQGHLRVSFLWASILDIK
jgi:hypothetical protein